MEYSGSAIEGSHWSPHFGCTWTSEKASLTGFWFPSPAGCSVVSYWMSSNLVWIWTWWLTTDSIEAQSRWCIYSCPILRGLTKASKISEIINSIRGTTLLPKVRPVNRASLAFPRIVRYRVDTHCLGRVAVSNDDSVTLYSCCVTALDIHRQHSFLVSCIFAPPVLWDSIKMLF